MGILDDLFDTVEKGVNALKNEAIKTSKNVDLRLKVVNLKKERYQKLSVLGEKVFQLLKERKAQCEEFTLDEGAFNLAEMSQEITPLVKEIYDLDAEIALKEKEIEESREAAKTAAEVHSNACPSCGAELSVNAKFCPECGLKIERKPVCANCGAELSVNAKFCPECGNQVQA